MDSSSQEGEEKKKVTEVKTFPVPFALEEEKKENISIPTNTPSNSSKEQLRAISTAKKPSYKRK